MRPSDQYMSCAKARNIDLVNYLLQLGFEPKKNKGNNFWYCSPFRIERTPSFKVNRRINKFYDFGIGWGGDLIDFGTHYYGCSVSQFLCYISGDFSILNTMPIIVDSVKDNSRIVITSEKEITSASLIRYLAKRGISLPIAQKYCNEVRYKVNERCYYGIGFKNDKGGFEIRNPYFKNGSTPKAITTIRKGFDTVSVFEGFFDFLSFIVLKIDSDLMNDFLILNSLSFFETSKPLMESYQIANLYLDNDHAGQNCSCLATVSHKCYQNKSQLYWPYKDLNDFLTGSG